MSLEDPFFVVRDEVKNSLGHAQQLYRKWQALLNDPAKSGGEEYEYASKELLTQLRSIEWDLEDLSETVSVVEVNPAKFRLNAAEIQNRKSFIYESKDSVKQMKEHVNSPEVKSKVEQHHRKSLLGQQPKRKDKYTRLDNAIEEDNQRFIEGQHEQQQMIFAAQDEQLALVGQSVNVLKVMGEEIGNELDDQNKMLDEFTEEVDNTQSKLDYTLLRVEKVLRLADDKRQMCVIAILLVIVVVVVLLMAFTL